MAFLAIALFFSPSCKNDGKNKPADTKEANKQQQADVSGWKKLDGDNYSIQYPPEWELNQTGQMGSKFILFAPSESAQDQFRENINLIVNPLPAGGSSLNLKEVGAASEQQIKSFINNAQIETNEVQSNANGDYCKMVYTGDQGTYHLKFEQYYFIKDNTAFVLTFTTDKETFATYKDTGEKILNSFLLK